MYLNNMPKASIIIPVYNAEKTLPYCLESILNQTFEDFEIILINDGSKDNSQKILEDYQMQYPNKIRLYSQKNLGVGNTRNKGIKLAKGEFLFFVDNDDYLDSDYLETFIKEIQGSNSDMVIGGYKRVDIDNNKILYRKDTSDNQWVKYMFPGCWAKIYKTSSLKKFKLQFLDINIGDDLFFSVVGNLCLKVSITSYNGYNWVYNRESVLNTNLKNIHREVSLIPLFNAICKEIGWGRISREEKDFIEYFFIKTIIYYILHSGRGTKFKILKDETDNLFGWIMKKFPQYDKNSNISPFRPKGEDLFVRFVIYIYFSLKRLGLENLFLKFYSKLPK